ncbi:family 78 glycoside hydrolase catalytic domain [Schumannella luteola]
MPKRFITPVITRLTVDRSTASFVAQPRPRLSWTASADGDWRQASALLRLTRGGLSIEHRHDGPECVDVEWPFDPLHPREEVALEVQVVASDGSRSPWSAPQTFGAGFLGDGEWHAEFLTDGAGPSRFRTEFAIPTAVTRATLFATARGVFVAHLNDDRVSDDVLAPGWTAYRQRLTLEAWDVTAQVSLGVNHLELTVAGGWYTESYGFGDDHARYYGDEVAVAAQLHLEFEDGTASTVRTDGAWSVSSTGPLVSSGIYAGEEFDATRTWTGWRPARVADRGILPSARSAPPVRRQELVAVREVLETPSGARVLDFGQNLVGRVRLVSRGRPGDVITLRHAEVLEGGELALRPLRRATACDRYTHGGDGPEVWEPEFTFHGFRYVQVDGVAELRAEDYTAVVLHSDLERTGSFESSSPLLNRLHENVVWSMRGNTLALPTDCPQRDERLGWTGDVQVFALTAAFLYNCDAFLASWLEDLALEQSAADGVVPVVIPWVIGWEPTEVAGWGDAATVVPWVLYERFGDRSVLERQAASMRAWADRLRRRADGTGLILGGFQFGDWLDPAAPPEHPERGATSPDLVASAWYIRSLDLVARLDALLGVADAGYAADAVVAREAFRARFVAGPRLTSDSATAYALAIAFDLVPGSELQFGDRLAELVRAAGHRITTGFLGTPVLLDALSSTGHANDAVDLLLQEECPSWLYPVTMGATTVWERWDSMRPDGSLNPGEMTSFNHYALGSVADWMHRRLAGLSALEPGYRVVGVAPHITARLDSARAELRTPYGLASSGWSRRADGSVRVECTIPTGARGVVELPTGAVHEVGPGMHGWTL